MRTATATHDYYLVQRMTARTANPFAKKGLDAAFDFDYMGSSEFEWGALPKTLAAMREDDVIVYEQPVLLGGETRPVYFAGHANTMSAALDGFAKWVSGGFRGKETSYFSEAAAGNGHGINGWWSIGEGVAFFLDRKLAQRFADAVNAGKPAE